LTVELSYVSIPKEVDLINQLQEFILVLQLLVLVQDEENPRKENSPVDIDLDQDQGLDLQEVIEKIKRRKLVYLK